MFDPLSATVSVARFTIRFFEGQKGNNAKAEGDLIQRHEEPLSRYRMMRPPQAIHM